MRWGLGYWGALRIERERVQRSFWYMPHTPSRGGGGVIVGEGYGKAVEERRVRGGG